MPPVPTVCTIHDDNNWLIKSPSRSSVALAGVPVIQSQASLPVTQQCRSIDACAINCCLGKFILRYRLVGLEGGRNETRLFPADNFLVLSLNQLGISYANKVVLILIFIYIFYAFVWIYYSAPRKYSNYRRIYFMNILCVIYDIFFHFITTVCCHCNSKIWNRSENVYRSYKTFNCEHTPSKKLVYGMNNSLKYAVSAKDSFTTGCDFLT